VTVAPMVAEGEVEQRNSGVSETPVLRVTREVSNSRPSGETELPQHGAFW
jgi:hypothetical protein